MFRTKQRLLSAALALVLVLALSVTAFAAWPSFQGHVDNNGVIDNGTPPITAPSVTPVSLSTAGGGIDATSVIGGGYAYTLYTDGTNGACLAITNLANPAAPTTPFVIDSNASGIQLSTPYLDYNTGTASDTLYVLTSQSSSWALWSVDVTDPTDPGTPNVLAKGDGQANTPISAATDTSPAYLYFGSYSDSKSGSYYQYNVTAQALVTFTPQFAYTRGDDFYLAGAAFVNVAGRDWVVFGSDSPNLYVRAVDSFGSALVGNVVALVDTVNRPGTVRSSIVKKTISSVEYIFFTSGGASSAILWQIRVEDLLKAATIAFVNSRDMKARTTTSTPVISDNGYIYVGSYNNDGTGSVEAYTPGDGTTMPPTLADVIYSGDAVQSSPIVYSDGPEDFIYFTAYGTNGAGYCYSFDGSAASFVWTEGGTSGNPAALQGFSSDDDYLVYGDDSNTLYIMH